MQLAIVVQYVSHKWAVSVKLLEEHFPCCDVLALNLKCIDRSSSGNIKLKMYRLFLLPLLC